MIVPQAAIRLALVGLVAGIVQIAAVSQVTVLGVSADLTPLIVASTGLLCGSVIGASMGFWMGLWIDIALLQTLGVTSLVMVCVGYAAGRLREVRDPAHTLIPIAVGAAATAAAEIGFSIMQFLLGVDAPVSALLIRQILATVLVNALLALPVHALMRRLLASSLPEDPRRRRRRAYATGGLSPLSRA